MINNNNQQIIHDILNDVMNGSLSSLTYDNKKIINNESKRLYKEHSDVKNLSLDDVICLGDIIKISNILFNNTDRSLIPLDDGVYDLLLELYKLYTPNYQVGAIPIHFKESETIKDNDTEFKYPIKFMDKDKIEDFIFMDNIMPNIKPSKVDLMSSPISYMYDNNPISKRVLNQKHVYPKLVGTLDKCKFVLNSQAEEKGVIGDSNVLVLERDFFQQHIKNGILDPQIKIRMMLQLKYDGVSVEAEVANQLLSARGRGDANEDIAADLSPILNGYKFPLTYLDIKSDDIFGMKFEAIMTYDNLYKYNMLKGKEYKNCRTAISGLFSSSDAAQYRDFITLVPLATSMEDIDQETEVIFMNKYYNTGVPMHYAVIEGTYSEILFQIKRFVEEAEYMRDFMPFMYDGVVISYMDKDIVNKLGRKNAVNKYSMAIKFNPLKKSTIFNEYTFEVGQDGSITPMIHYQPVEFYGTIHDKSTGHSFKRFKELNLKVGDIIDVEYVNDVMPYVTKPDNSYNANNINPVINFITQCPSCGSKLRVSDSGKSVYCDNIECPQRNMARMVNMLDKLNIKDFSEAYLTKINRYSLSELMNVTLEDVMFLGEVTAIKFMDRIDTLKTKEIYDFKIIGSLGFTNIASEKWKYILNVISLSEMLCIDKEELRDMFISIKGIGSTTADTILEQFEFFRNDLVYISNMKNVIQTKGMKFGKSIRFTGVRDKELMEYLQSLDHDATDGGVTKSTDILLVPTSDHKSSKIDKLGPNGIVVPINEFKTNMNKYLNTN